MSRKPVSSIAAPPSKANWHAQPPDRVLETLESRRDGLSPEEVAERRRRFGPNRLPEAKPKSLAAIYLTQFKSAFIYLLLAAAVVTLVLAEYGDAIFIFVTLQLNAAIGTYQEWRAQRRVEALKAFVPNWVLVRRGGETRRIRALDVVPGDVVMVETGVKVPADIRLLDCRNLRVDESLLTGESTPVDKSAEAVLDTDTPLSDRSSMLHGGTVVTGGRGRGVVVATAAHTQVGQIAEALAEPIETTPPLVTRMARFTRVVAVAMVGVIALIAGVEALRGVPAAEIFLIAVGLAVAAIPEGLPVALTVALSISVSRMAERNVVVRRLFAVEGLGACTLIAADKTGTLTCNELTIRRVYLPGAGELKVSGEGYGMDGSVSHAGESMNDAMWSNAAALARSGALASESKVEVSDDGEVTPLGDTVDAAFHVFAVKMDGSEDRDSEIVATIPYEPEKRFAAAFTRGEANLEAHVKGAVETLLPMCRREPAGGPLDDDTILEATRKLASEGFRVLAVAGGPVERTGAENLDGLTFLGLVGLIDPLRPEAGPALERCRGAGIAVRMITGDHPVTALAIARELGLAQDLEEVVTGRELDKADNDAALDAVVGKAKVFARIEPMQKLAIVTSLQRQGHFVAVTGDGVNDAPALSTAHIGAAMGRSGTDVARQASDLILTDDNFASIVAGVEEGRIAYSNIRKVIYLLISTGAAEIALFLFSLAAGLPMPLSAVQLLWLNLVTQGIQDVGLAFERGEPGLLNRKPRPPEEGIFDPTMILETAISGVFMGIVAFFFYEWLIESGAEPVEIRNRLLLLLVLFENAQVFNCRSETRSTFEVPLRHNLILIVGVVIAHGVHIAAMYTPGLSGVLGVDPVSLTEWARTALIAVSVIIVMELYKLTMGKRLEQNQLVHPG